METTFSINELPRLVAETSLGESWRQIFYALEAGGILDIEVKPYQAEGDPIWAFHICLVGERASGQNYTLLQQVFNMDDTTNWYFVCDASNLTRDGRSMSQGLVVGPR